MEPPDAASGDVRAFWDGPAPSLAAQALRQHLKQHPDIWQQVGDLARLAAERQIEVVSSGDVLLRESLLTPMRA